MAMMYKTSYYVLLVLQLLSSKCYHGCFAFTTSSSFFSVSLHQQRYNSITFLEAKASKTKSKNKKKKNSSSIGGVKGFSSGIKSGSSGSLANGVEIDRSKEALDFYNFIDRNPVASANLKRVALGHFPLSQDTKIRGVVAMKDFKKGDIILQIPYEMALNLGSESSDPTLPAVKLLNTIFYPGDDDRLKQDAYLKMLPEFMGSDCLGSTDFFSKEALDELQFPIVKDETIDRRENAIRRFEKEEFSSYDDNNKITLEHFQWAVWLVTSRVLTVQGSQDTPGVAYRLMIPFIDMCNHDRKSTHILSGRAVPGGTLKVIAGSPVKKGDQVNICYGGGVAGNDRFLQGE